MKKILPFWLSLSTLISTPLFANFELGVVPGFWIEYIQPSSLTYGMNIPGTTSYLGPTAGDIGSFNNLGAGGLGGDKLTFGAGIFVEGRFDLRFAWTGEDDPRNTIVADLKLRGRFDFGSRALLPDAELANFSGNENFLIDLYYQGFFIGMNGYIKFGKYLADIPYNWGGEINAPSLELGYDNPKYVKFFFNTSLYGWGLIANKWYTNDGGTTDSFYAGNPDDPQALYREPWGNGNFGDYVPASTSFSAFNMGSLFGASLITTFGLDVPISNLGQFTLRIPFEIPAMRIMDITNNFRIFPIAQLFIDNGFVFSNSHLGAAIRKADLGTNKALGYTVMTREEIGFRYLSMFETGINFGLQTSGKGYNTYAFTRLNSQNPIMVNQGIYTPYLYKEVTPYTGYYSLGASQSFTWHNFLFKLGIDSFWAFRKNSLPFRYYNAAGPHIGLNYFAGVDWVGITGAGSSFKLEASLFQPTQLSTLSGGVGAGALASGRNIKARHLYLAFRLMMTHTFR